MKEKPILFKGPMVVAVKQDIKTVTRRVMRYQPTPVPQEYIAMGWSKKGDHHVGLPCAGTMVDLETAAQMSPYGWKGDQLWVRETFAEKDGLVAYRADGQCGAWMGDGDGGRLLCHHGWMVDAAHNETGERFGLGRFGGKWKPSIHMPRALSRIQLEVLDVKVERVQEITPEACLAEGIEIRGLSKDAPFNAMNDFRWLWNGINDARGFGWEVNPWCWCVTFKKI